MPRIPTRFVLIAALTFGVIAMHSFGHSDHGGGRHGQITVTAHSEHHGHAVDAESISVEDDSDRSALLSVLGLMACGAVIARYSFECSRSGAWSRLWQSRIADMKRRERAPARHWLPPPRLEPTGIQISRVAVLRI